MAAEKTQLNVRLPQTTVERVKVIAAVEDRTVTDIMEEAVTTLVDQRKRSDEWQTKHKAWAEKQRALLKAMRL